MLNRFLQFFRIKKDPPLESQTIREDVVSFDIGVYWSQIENQTVTNALEITLPIGCDHLVGIPIFLDSIKASTIKSILVYAKLPVSNSLKKEIVELNELLMGKSLIFVASTNNGGNPYLSYDEIRFENGEWSERYVFQKY